MAIALSEASTYSVSYIPEERSMTNWVAEDQIGGKVAPSAPPIVRAATADDVAAIVEVVNENARLGHLLPRSPENIRASIHTWVLAEVDGRVVGIGSLLAMSPTLVEVRSLAVLPDYRRLGVGALVVHALVERAREQGIPLVFALTRAVSFFTRLGFVISARESFPEKVWKDCVICPLQHRCDETAVVLAL